MRSEDYLSTGEEIPFLSTFTFFIWKCVNYTNKGQIKRREGTLFLLIFTCIRVHKKEAKHKEAIRLSVYTPF